MLHSVRLPCSCAALPPFHRSRTALGGNPALPFRPRPLLVCASSSVRTGLAHGSIRAVCYVLAMQARANSLSRAQVQQDPHPEVPRAHESAPAVIRERLATAAIVSPMCALFRIAASIDASVDSITQAGSKPTACKTCDEDAIRRRWAAQEESRYTCSVPSRFASFPVLASQASGAKNTAKRTLQGPLRIVQLLLSVARRLCRALFVMCVLVAIESLARFTSLKIMRCSQVDAALGPTVATHFVVYPRCRSSSEFV